jgi:hypothetical protein
LYGSGTISAVSQVPPFSDPDKYLGVVPKPRQTSVAALDQEVKPSGVPNFNSRLYVDVSRQYGRDAFAIVKAHPSTYLRGLAESYFLYFLPASAYLFLDNNTARIKGLASFASILSGRFVYRFDRSLRRTRPERYYLQGFLNTGWFLILAYAFVLAFGPVVLFRRSSPFVPSASLPFIWYNVAWVTFVASALEVGENNRFRFVTDPLVCAFLAAVAVAWLRRRSGRARPVARE